MDLTMVPTLEGQFRPSPPRCRRQRGATFVRGAKVLGGRMLELNGFREIAVEQGFQEAATMGGERSAKFQKQLETEIISVSN